MDDRVRRYLNTGRSGRRHAGGRHDNSGCLKFFLITAIWVSVGVLPALLWMFSDSCTVDWSDATPGQFLVCWALVTLLTCVVFLGPFYAIALAVAFWPRRQDRDHWR